MEDVIDETVGMQGKSGQSIAAIAVALNCPISAGFLIVGGDGVMVVVGHGGVKVVRYGDTG